MTVSLRFAGAARTVTGMCLHFRTPRANFLVDCGMFQGPKSLKALNYEDFPFAPRDLDFVLLTHAHIDHSGLLPRLGKAGFRGPVHATRATADLCSVMLPDAGHIQETEVEQFNRRNRHHGRGPVQPIYTARDAERMMDHFRGVPLGRWIEPGPGVRARYWNAGHLLGSASIELEFAGEDGARPMRVLVSGDIGPDDAVLQRDPEAPSGLDHVIVESTYGDEDRPAANQAERRRQLQAIVGRAAARGGPLLVPAFAVERAQEVLWDLVALMEAKQIPQAPIFLDSPLAIRATEIFIKHARELEQGPALEDALSSPLIHFTESGIQSRRIAHVEGFHIVLAGSGMCEAGRIRHHLMHWLGQARATVMLVGFQAQGTLGRLLHDGAKAVRIQGQDIDVAADITELRGYSAHADGPELGRWLEARGPISGSIMMIHGEPDAQEGLRQRILGRQLVPDAAILRPMMDEVLQLQPGAVPQRAAQQGRPRSAVPERLGRPDWHNARAALLLQINEAIERAPDDAAREALIQRLRGMLAA